MPIKYKYFMSALKLKRRLPIGSLKFNFVEAEKHVYSTDAINRRQT